MLSKKNKIGVFGISFDSVALSGIIVEFLKIAELFHHNDYAIYLDLGYEIKSDKNNLFRPYSDENKLLPSWINLVKTLTSPFYNYSATLVEEILYVITQQPEKIEKYRQTIEDYSDYIAEKFIAIWEKLNIRVIIVENGTLPENIIFTKALYKAIDIYGQQHQLKKYVLWRDHDLMWSSEANINKYGITPYRNLPKITSSRYIAHIVLHQADHDEAMNWCPNACIKILNNNFDVEKLSRKISDSDRIKIRDNFRKAYNIPSDAYVLARFTRIIPQKRIDRDIHLLYLLHQQSISEGKLPNIYLVIAGNINENPNELHRLNNYISRFKLEKNVIFTGELTPIDFAKDLFEKSILSLIIASDFCSFLTSYQYESFGNPISESISLNKVYITTSYERYKHVYDDKGYKGLVLPISEYHDSLATQEFASEVLQLLHSIEKQIAIINHNKAIMQAQQKHSPPFYEKINQLLDVKLQEPIQNDE